MADKVPVIDVLVTTIVLNLMTLVYFSQMPSNAEEYHLSVHDVLKWHSDHTSRTVDQFCAAVNGMVYYPRLKCTCLPTNSQRRGHITRIIKKLLKLAVEGAAAVLDAIYVCLSDIGWCRHLRPSYVHARYWMSIVNFSLIGLKLGGGIFEYVQV